MPEFPFNSHKQACLNWWCWRSERRYESF